MKAKTIEELRKEFFKETESLELVDYNYLKWLEQKLIQPEPQRGNWRQELFSYFSNEHNINLLESDMNEVHNIIKSLPIVSEPKQVTEDEMYNKIDFLILQWLKSGNENTNYLAHKIMQYFKGLTLQNKEQVTE